MERDEKERIRILYSIHDFQTALSAADFLSECDVSKKFVPNDISRFKCYETTLVISYARPFSTSRGNFPRFSFDLIGMTLNAEQEVLHSELLALRDRVFAHSDKRMMRLSSKMVPVEFESGERVHFPNLQWDTGLVIYGERLAKTINFLRAVLQQIASHQFPKMQNTPELYDFSLNHLGGPETESAD